MAARGSKAGRNEKRKLLATFINNLAAAFTLAGVLQPALALVQHQRTVTSAELTGSAAFLLVALVFLISARYIVSGLED